jgi:hypothetical protein
MAFLKRASAVVVHPRISGRGWGGIRKTASAGSDTNLTDQAREILGGSLSSDDYLVTHCTIVASVDTDNATNAKLGRVKVGSQTVNRKWADYLIKPECAQFVNNNGDSWSRDVLRLAYPTFIGAHNFREHVQIEDQSKGRIIDAVARDIGDSLYVDILVATNKKHAALVQDISSGKMATLSMGCTTDFTTCSKCGHFAVDETELCDHIKYAKLNTFMDDTATKRVIAELCGHQSYDENPDAPGGVRFIEASWVAVPAFPGAVMRNILDPSQAPDAQVRKVLASPPSQWSDHAVAKAASMSAVAFDFGDDEGGEEDAPAAADAKPSSPFQGIEDAVYESLKVRVKERLERDLAQKAVEDSEPEPDATMEPNDSLIKEGSTGHRTSVNTLVRVASSPVALVDGLASIDSVHGVKVARHLYRVALEAGVPTEHPSLDRYLFACKKAAGRVLSTAEIRVVVRVGTLLARWADDNNNPKPHYPKRRLP